MKTKLLMVVAAVSLVGNVMQWHNHGSEQRDREAKFSPTFSLASLDERVILIPLLADFEMINDPSSFIEMRGSNSKGVYYLRKNAKTGARVSCFIAAGSVQKTECKTMAGLGH